MKGLEAIARIAKSTPAMDGQMGGHRPPLNISLLSFTLTDLIRQVKSQPMNLLTLAIWFDYGPAHGKNVEQEHANCLGSLGIDRCRRSGLFRPSPWQSRSISAVSGHGRPMAC